MKWLPGFFWLCVLFAACFSCVHILLAFLPTAKDTDAAGELASSEEEQSQTEDSKETAKPSSENKPKSTRANTPEKTSEKEPEPIYYIVEKKSKRKKEYSKPKRIKFE